MSCICPAWPTLVLSILPSYPEFYPVLLLRGACANETTPSYVLCTYNTYNTYIHTYICMYIRTESHACILHTYCTCFTAYMDRDLKSPATSLPHLAYAHLPLTNDNARLPPRSLPHAPQPTGPHPQLRTKLLLCSKYQLFSIYYQPDMLIRAR
ncbi:hypothetical protein EV426DRAFT_246112 [Tirmania nivea]|nr:hypothetical protein EV426DRAFT_246112 [Tirmania nivea]